MRPNNILLIAITTAFILLTGCRTPAPELTEQEAAEYGRDLLTRNVPPEELPGHLLSLHLAQIRKRIEEKTHEARNAHPYLTEQGDVVMTFKLYPDGRIKDLKATSGMEYQTLVQIATQGVYQAMPFGPCPSEAKPLFSLGFIEFSHGTRFRTLSVDPIDIRQPQIFYGPPSPRNGRYIPTPPQSRFR